jgi:hypothetical protein
MLLKKHSLSSTKIYSMIEDAGSLSERILLGSPGSITKRATSSGLFYYRQFYKNRIKTDEYIGSTNSYELAQLMGARIQKAKEEIRLIRFLAMSGYLVTDEFRGDYLVEVFNNGFFKQGMVLSGYDGFNAIFNHLGIKIEINQRAVKTLKNSQVKPQLLSNKFAHAFLEDVEITPLLYQDYLLESKFQTVVISKKNIIPVFVPGPSELLIHHLHMKQNFPNALDENKVSQEQLSILLIYLIETSVDKLEIAFNNIPKEIKNATIEAVKIFLRKINENGTKKFIIDFLK